MVRGWAGLYEVNRLDSNAILGPWPELEGFYLINGFSGHGLQQSPAAGRYLGVSTGESQVQEQSNSHIVPAAGKGC
jgi:hypothetical protein